MKRTITICIAALLLSGCFKKEEPGIGVLPLEGVKLDGKIVESDDSGVLLRTNGGRTALLPDDWEYRQGDKTVEARSLDAGQPVTVFAPSEEGKLVAASGKNLVLASGDDTYTLPVEAFPAPVREYPVRVQTYGGQSGTLPLQNAVYSPEYTVMSHPSYSAYDFPVAEPYSVSRAYVVGQHNSAPLALVPGSSNLQLVSLPTSAYPVNNLRTSQPVRFTYLNDNVAVSSWDSLSDGEIGLSEVLLAGTLLDVLPGQAVIEVGSQPVVVPQSFVWNNGQPLAWNNVQPGYPVDVRYYPGVYQVVDYSNDYFTLSYNDNIVQFPVNHLPDSFYHQPVAVYQQRGKVKRMPYGQAKKLIGRGEARICAAPVANRYVNRWQALNQQYQRPIRGHGDYVVYNERGMARVAPRNHKKWKSNPQVVYGGQQYSPKRAKQQFNRNYKPAKADKGQWKARPVNSSGNRHHAGPGNRKQVQRGAYQAPASYKQGRGQKRVQQKQRAQRRAPAKQERRAYNQPQQQNRGKVKQQARTHQPKQHRGRASAQHQRVSQPKQHRGGGKASGQRGPSRGPAHGGGGKGRGNGKK